MVTSETPLSTWFLDELLQKVYFTECYKVYCDDTYM